MATKTGRSHACDDFVLTCDLLSQISLAVFLGQHKCFLLPYFVRLPLGRILNFLYTILGVCVSVVLRCCLLFCKASRCVIAEAQSTLHAAFCYFFWDTLTESFMA